MLKTVIAQIFGVGAMISLFLLYQQKNRKKLVTCKLCADICWCVHYFLLAAYGGIVPNFVGIFRELVFAGREEKKWANNIIFPILFILLNLSIGAFTFKSPANILPVTASVFVTVSLWLKNVKLTKMISIPVSLAFLVYDFWASSYIGMLNETLSIISIGIYFINKRRKEKENDNDIH